MDIIDHKDNFLISEIVSFSFRAVMVETKEIKKVFDKKYMI